MTRFDGFETDEDRRAYRKAQGLAEDAPASPADVADGELEVRPLPTTPEEYREFFGRRFRKLLFAGERRLEFLRERVRRHGDRFGGQVDYDKAELAFVEASIAALLWFEKEAKHSGEARAVLKGLADEAEWVYANDTEGFDAIEHDKRTADLIQRAHAVLKELEP